VNSCYCGPRDEAGRSLRSAPCPSPRRPPVRPACPRDARHGHEEPWAPRRRGRTRCAPPTVASGLWVLPHADLRTARAIGL